MTGKGRRPAAEGNHGGIEYELVSHPEGTGVHLFVVTIHQRQTHYHSDFELFIPIDGSVYIGLADKRHRVRQGDFFFVNAYEAHSLTGTEEPNLLLVLQASPNFCRAYYPQFAALRLLQRHITAEWAPRLYEGLRCGLAEALHSVAGREPGAPLALFAALNRLACSLVRHGIYQDPSVSALGRKERGRARMMDIAGYIQDRYANRPSLEELAKKEGLDVSYLSHFIRQSFGISFREYVHRLRLERAAALIFGTDRPLIDVCLESGFSDCRYLNRAIRQEYGASPAQLRAGEAGQAERTLFSGGADGREHEITQISLIYGHLCERLSALAAAPGGPDAGESKNCR